MKKYDNHFLKLIDFKLVKNCKHIQAKHPITKDPYFNEKYETLAKSKYCLEIVTDLKDGSISKRSQDLTRNDCISILIQITYALYLMNQKGIYHCDINTDNICYTKTEEPFLDIFGLEIPTYGYIYSLIDYGNSESLNYINTEKNEILLKQGIFRIQDHFVLLASFLYPKNMKAPAD
jgi:serine/threonine protein kinase